MISITEQITVPSPRERVWAVISNPSEVVSCISGAELVGVNDDGSYDGTLTVKFASVRVRFAATVSLDLVPEEFEGRLTARGRDGQKATRFSAGATFRVAEGAEPGESRVAMSGEIQLNGKLAGLVEAGANAVVSRMTKDFTARLIERCAQPGPGETGPAAAEQRSLRLVDPSGQPAQAIPQPENYAVEGIVAPAVRTDQSLSAPALPGAPDSPRGLGARVRAWWRRRKESRLTNSKEESKRVDPR